MAIPLVKILNKLRADDMFDINATEYSNVDMELRPHPKDIAGLNSRDPRWFGLFTEFFIDADEITDDILFFVRQYVPFNKSSTGSINDMEPVFVKRRIARKLPLLADVIDWRRSFYINLISQLPCTLTISVCTKLAEGDTKIGYNKKSIMIASQRITKKVYASPYKSRMDTKDAFMNECSYPLIYYTINDFEAQTLQLAVTSNEYLCAELSVTIPDSGLSADYYQATDVVSNIPIDKNSDPFPVPDKHTKLTLFQGAVSFNAMASVYQQKVVSNSMNVWDKYNGDDSDNNTKFVLMRGPQGRGQCQVAMQEPDAQVKKVGSPSMYRYFKDVVKSQLGQEPTKSVNIPKTLQCSMTYVNIAWQSIIVDLFSIPPSS